MKRVIALPANLLPVLDAALDKIMADAAAGRIPDFGLDAHPGTMTITIERSDLPALKLVEPTNRRTA